MPGASLFTLLDDIATLLDDVAVLSKVAMQKTAGVLGDDLALNAKQVTGISADREIPVVWRVAVGSLMNKAILVPLALLISATVPWAVMPLLMIGGAYLCYEGVEKLVHAFLHRHEDDRQKRVNAVLDTEVDMVSFEKDRIQGAIRTDFILSAEIIVITLGTIATQTFAARLMVLTIVAIAMTVGVYGIVACIVKLDDLGLYLTKRPGNTAAVRNSHRLGRMLLNTAPYLMKFLSVAGTVAMFLVGGGIISHNVPALHDWNHHWTERVHDVAMIGPGLAFVFPLVFETLLGIAVGAVAVVVVMGVTSNFFSATSKHSTHA